MRCYRCGDWFGDRCSCKDGQTIFHGDCKEILSELPEVDLVLTDPPYGKDDTHKKHLSTVVLRDGSAARQGLGFDGITGSEMVELTEAWVKISRWVVFSCEWKFAHLLEEAGLLIRLGIWRKPDGAPQFTGDRPGTGWEAIAICHAAGKKRCNGGGSHAFYEYPKGGCITKHPTEKPIRLFKKLVSDFSDPGLTVLDPFMGSGTTLRASKDQGRSGIGIEKQEKYCEIAAERLRQGSLF